MGERAGRLGPQPPAEVGPERGRGACTMVCLLPGSMTLTLPVHVKNAPHYLSSFEVLPKPAGIMIWRWSAHSKFINHVPLSRGFTGLNRPSSPTSKGRDNSSNPHTRAMTRGRPNSRTQVVWPGSKSEGVFFLRCGTIFAGSGFPGTPRGPNCSRCMSSSDCLGCPSSTCRRIFMLSS
jgi:hypothetical protein